MWWRATFYILARSLISKILFKQKEALLIEIKFNKNKTIVKYARKFDIRNNPEKKL